MFALRPTPAPGSADDSTLKRYFEHLVTERKLAPASVKLSYMSEVLSIRVGDIDSERKLVRIDLGKGGEGPPGTALPDPAGGLCPSTGLPRTFLRCYVSMTLASCLRAVGFPESKPGPRHRLARSLFSLLPPGFPAVTQYLCHAAVRSRLLAEPDLECYTIRLPA
jgi:hypothetical protein